MRYLKSFNESITNEEILEIKNFCEEHLIDLMDEGFYVKVYNAYNYLPLHYKLVYNNARNDINEYLIVLSGKEFRWVDYKDRIIPFLEITGTEYNIKHNKIAFVTSNRLKIQRKEYLLDSLLESDILDESKLVRLELRVAVKK